MAEGNDLSLLSGTGPKCEVTTARRAMKNGVIVETMMISQRERIPAFSIRTGFSVSTTGKAERGLPERRRWDEKWSWSSPSRSASGEASARPAIARLRRQGKTEHLGRPRLVLDRAKIHGLHKEGWSVRKIVGELGVSPMTIQRIVTAA
jgi:hypothetical protein